MTIHRRALIRGAATAASAALCTPWLARPARAQTTLRMQGFLGSNSPTHRAFEAMAKELEAETEGALAIQFVPAGSVVEPGETLDAIANGLLDGHYSSPSFFAAKRPAFRVLGDTGAAFDDVATRDRWFEEGAGVELGRRLYDEAGAHYVDQVYWPAEHIPSKRRLAGAADLEGLKIRVPPGMISEVFGRAGAAVVNLPGGEVFNALQTGVIDATDWANPGTNMEAGLYRVATFSVDASHSMPTTEVSFAKGRWEGLPDDQRALIEAKVAALSDTLRAQIQADDAAALEAIRAEGVEVVRWEPEEIALLREITAAVQDDDAARDPLAAEIVESLRALQAEVGL